MSKIKYGEVRIYTTSFRDRIFYTNVWMYKVIVKDVVWFYMKMSKVSFITKDLIDFMEESKMIKFIW